MVYTRYIMFYYGSGISRLPITKLPITERLKISIVNIDYQMSNCKYGRYFSQPTYLSINTITDNIVKQHIFGM